VNILNFTFFPENKQQTLRIQRLLFANITYCFSLLLAFGCQYFGFIEPNIVQSYLILFSSVNFIFYIIIRSNLNLKLHDPSLTLVQMITAIFFGLFLMFYTNEARSIFSIMSISLVIYGMFKFKTRDFIIVSSIILLGYATLIYYFSQYQPQHINIPTEILQWLAMTVTLLQFSFLGGYIGNLREKIKQNNIDLAQRNIELEVALQRNVELAIRDELTGVYNRRYLMQMINLEQQRCNRNNQTFYFCLLDIDFFKKVNDTYGHLAGDLVLQKIANTIQDSMRNTDYFGRYGGEEFAMVLTSTNREGALLVAERIKDKIQLLSFPTIHNDLVVTISTGVSEYQLREDTSLTFQRADIALYNAKENGRNRVFSDFPENLI
jgi:diguanylate cyclase (GGDEF)-like protein